MRLSIHFESEILIDHRGETIDCKSILSILTLGASDGTELVLRATGADAQQAIGAITEFFESGFQEPQELGDA